MSQPIRIQDLRMTFFWADTTLDLLESQRPPDAAIRRLGRRSSYEATVRQAQSTEEACEIPGLETPWNTAGKSYFWSYYLGRSSMAEATGRQAWNALVPLRGDVPFSVKARLPDGVLRPAIEVFYYPFGLVYAVSLRFRGDASLEEVVARSMIARHGLNYLVHWDPEREEGVGERVSLAGLADRAISRVREHAFGADARSAGTSIKPFSVVTVVQGTGVDPTEPVESGGALHRALDAWSAWYQTWRTSRLPDLEEARVPIRSRSPLGHVLYGTDDGRVVWFPSAFLPKEAPTHSLSCYHRNLLLLSMQVEGMGQFARATASALAGGRRLSDAHEQCARHAAEILGRLYCGEDSTYRSWSTPRQMKDHGFDTAVSELRRHYYMLTLDQLCPASD